MCLYLKNFPCTLLMELRPLVCNTALSSHIQVITVTYFRLDCGLVSAELESSTPHKASHTVNCTSRTSKEHESCAFFKTGRDRDSCRKDTFVSGRPLKIFQDSKWAELKHFMRIQWPIWEVLSKATCKSLGRLHYTHRLQKYLFEWPLFTENCGFTIISLTIIVTCDTPQGWVQFIVYVVNA